MDYDAKCYRSYIYVCYRIWSHLLEITSTGETTVIVTTHYIEEARQAHMVINSSIVCYFNNKCFAPRLAS